MSQRRPRLVARGMTLAYAVPATLLVIFGVVALLQQVWATAVILLVVGALLSLRARQRLSGRGSHHDPAPIRTARNRRRQGRDT